MKRSILVVTLLALLISGCTQANRPSGSAGGAGCDPFQSDLDKEPNYSANYLHRWETASGCPIRLDILMTRQGPDACGGDKVADILMGTPLGKPSDESPRIYVKDPTNVFNDDATANAYDSAATLPDTARDSGYRQDGAEMWIVPEDDQFIFLVTGDNAERWPLDPSPAGCD
jgi:hypothetical protein